MSIPIQNLVAPVSSFAGTGLADIPLDQIVFVAFDTETTGLSPVTSRLVELCGVKFTADGQDISTFRALIDPEVRIPAAATGVHGITDQMVRGMPKYEAVVPEFIEWCSDSESWSPLSKGKHREPVLLAHNASFDVSFLEVALCKLRQTVPANTVLDTLSLSRALIKDVETTNCEHSVNTSAVLTPHITGHWQTVIT